MVQGMRVIGTPGASLHTSGLNADNIDAGIEGEQLVAACIERALQNTQATVVHSAKLHPKRGDTDHLVLVGDKLLIIDSKLWAGRTFTATPGPDGVLQVERDGAVFAGGTVALPRQRSIWAKHLGIPESDVFTLLAVARGGISVPKEPVDGVHFATIDSLPLRINELIGAYRHLEPKERIDRRIQQYATTAATTGHQPADLLTITPRWAPALPLLWALALFSGDTPVYWVSAAALVVATVTLSTSLLRHRPGNARPTLLWFLASLGILAASLAMRLL